MKPALDEQDITIYASDAQTIQEPYGSDYTQGVRVGRTIPAKWWNWLFKAVTTRLHQAFSDVTSIFTELSNLLTDAQITPSASDNTQIEQAITVKANEQITKYMENKQGFPTQWDEAIVNLGILENARLDYNVYSVTVDDIAFSFLWVRRQAGSAWYKQILIASKLDDKPAVVINSDYGMPDNPLNVEGYKILTPFKDKIILNELSRVSYAGGGYGVRSQYYIDKNDLSIHVLPAPSTRPGFRCLCCAVVEDTLYMIGCDVNAPDYATFLTTTIMYRTTDLITFTECTVASGTLAAWTTSGHYWRFSVENNEGYGMLQVAQPPIHNNGRYYIGTAYIQDNVLHCVDSMSDTIYPSTSSSPIEKLPNGDIAIWPYFILHTADDTTSAVTLTSSETLRRPAGSNRIFKYNMDTAQDSYTDDGINWTALQGYILGFDGKYYYTKNSRTLDLQTFEDITEFFPEEVAEWIDVTFVFCVIKGLTAIFGISGIHRSTRKIYLVTTDKLKNPALWYHIEQLSETNKILTALRRARSLSDNRIVCIASVTSPIDSGWQIVIWDRYRSYISTNRVYNNTLYLR